MKGRRGIVDLPARWEAVVVGAGPAGAMAALLLAGSGVRTLLVDRAAFPRDKVCGGCISAFGLAALERHGLGDLPARGGGRRVDRLDLRAYGRSATLHTEPGVALSRRALDQALVTEAVERGCVFRDGTTATVGSCEGRSRHLKLRKGDRFRDLRAGVVVVADGLSGSALGDARSGRWRWTWRQARIGLGAVVQDTGGLVEEGAVAMAVGRQGYLGAVRVEGGRVDLAAAVDPAWLRRQPGPEKALGAILSDAGASLPGWPPAGRWSGTVPLTRRPARLAGERLFVLGDAAGYVEPFTGEGIGWALVAAEQLWPIAVRAARSWSTDLAAAWTARHRRTILGRQRRCRLIASALRRPLLVRGLVGLLAIRPRLARPMIRGIQLQEPPMRPRPWKMGGP
jgi:flavin-dependent dehydrogenase